MNYLGRKEINYPHTEKATMQSQTEMTEDQK